MVVLQAREALEPPALAALAEWGERVPQQPTLVALAAAAALAVQVLAVLAALAGPAEMDSAVVLVTCKSITAVRSPRSVQRLTVSSSRPRTALELVVWVVPEGPAARVVAALAAPVVQVEPAPFLVARVVLAVLEVLLAAQVAPAGQVGLVSRAPA